MAASRLRGHIVERMQSSFLRCSIFFAVLFGSVAAAQAPKDEAIRAEGSIVAYHPQSRIPRAPRAPAFASYVEHLIVRIDRWGDGEEKPTFVLVRHIISETALSEEDINGRRWAFDLRKPNPKEIAPCAVRTIVVRNHKSTHRKAVLQDYKRTAQGTSAQIPPIEELPCFIVTDPPSAID